MSEQTTAVVLNATMLLGVLLGAWLKGKTWFPNQAIPWAVLVFQGLRNLILSATGVDPGASADATPAGFMDVAGELSLGKLAEYYLQAPWWVRTLGDTAMTIGSHGFTKNGVKQGLWQLVSRYVQVRKKL